MIAIGLRRRFSSFYMVAYNPRTSIDVAVVKLLPEVLGYEDIADAVRRQLVQLADMALLERPYQRPFP